MFKYILVGDQCVIWTSESEIMSLCIWSLINLLWKFSVLKPDPGVKIINILGKTMKPTGKFAAELFCDIWCILKIQ
jgi:hypothetical protein